MAVLMGVNIDRVVVMTFILGGLMAGVAALLFGTFFEVTQYNTRPEGNCSEKNKNMSGMICMARFIWACCGSTEGGAIMRWMPHWVTAVRTGKM